ncbi:MAG TPA: type II toxin-antitoxin system RelE/ParE family toxin [Phycisphaerae bacterium]|nr:type II toxin-antitoxin system RelE/ParE family toxin [Phycisphaerae bacterium]
MAYQVSWLDAALLDLEGIVEFIFLDSPAYASVVAARVLAEARLLCEFPRIGRCVPEWDDENIRERIIYSYRLIYQVGDGEITILAVIHGARNLPDEIRNR